MSEIENSTTDIDNNVQEEAPKATPKKRLSRAEKARLESEELLKSYGVTIESGRQTRSSRRSTAAAVESPKPEPPKRRQPSTPRASKKAKVVETADQTDGGSNHVDESNKNETQIAEASTTNSVEPEKVAAEPVEAAPSEPDQKMEVDTTPAVESSTQPEEETQAESVPQPEPVQESPIEEPPTRQEPAVEESSIDDEPPIEEDSLPIAVDEVESVTPSTAVDVSEVVESEGVSAAAADTTTTIVINDSEPVITSPPESNRDKDEPIELQSSPSDIDPQENTVTNSQAVVVVEPDAIVDLESSNSGDDVAISDEVNDSQALNSLELEAINSDSSLGVAEIQDDQPSSGGEAAAAAAQESPLPTSTADITITADVASVAKTNNDNSVHSSEQAQTNAVESTNNQKPIEIPDNFRTTITVDNPIEETITTTSETLLEPSATTA